MAVVATGALLAACASPQPTTPPPPPQPPVQPPPPPPPVVAPPRLGLLLPLTGNAAAVGRDMLDAAQMALFEFGSDELVLLPRDTGDTPEGAAAAARAALDEGARLIVGPLSSAATPAARGVAARRGVKVLAFTNDAAAAGGGAWVLGFRPEEQVERVVGYAQRRGLTRLAALVPDDAYGQRAAGAFRAVVGNGAIVVTYPVGDGADPSEAIDRLLAMTGDRIDALLLADGGLRMQGVLEILRFRGLDPSRVRLLGTARWLEDPDLAHSPLLRGAWVAAVDPAAADAFARRFADAYGRVPGPLAGLAYDATALAAALLTSPTSIDQETLTAEAGFAGRLGIFRLLPNGLTEHGLAVLELGGGAPLVLEPAPRLFPPTPVGPGA